MMQILIIDNDDSFTFNLVDILRNIETVNCTVTSSNNLKIDDLGNYDRVIISPGPMKPANFPILSDAIAYCAEAGIQMLGVCLGHQAICEFFGGKLFRLAGVVHGQKRSVEIDTASHLYKGLPATIDVGLYHSWAIEINALPKCLKISGISSDNYLMSVEHISHKIYGVQYHPESFLTAYGKQILLNFLGIRYAY